MNILTNLDQTHFEDQGYLILREIFAPERVKALRMAVIRMIDRGLAGDCQLKWIDADSRLPARTEHMLHPDKYDPAWAEWLAEDLVFYIDALVSGPARHSLFGMLAGGGRKSYSQAWHRDMGRPGVPIEETFLARFKGQFVQFNAPLVSGDCFLQIVPGSHLRASTEAELRVAQNGGSAAADGMPGTLTVELEPGDIAFYNPNLWHRGFNPEGRKRWTMHCAFWKAEYTVMSHEYGQREALMTDGHIERMPENVAEYVRRYLAKYPEGEPPSVLDI